MGHCTQYSAVYYNYIGSTAYDLRHRTGYNGDGTGIHGGQHNEHFNTDFWTTCGYWIGNLNYYTETYPPVSGQPYTVSWVGDVGVGVCKTGYHGQARAFDLTRIQFIRPDGISAYADMNWSWNHSELIHRRRYLDIAAQCRRYFGTVLTAWYVTGTGCVGSAESAHNNHIHFDNGAASGAINDGLHSDTTLIQAACNLLNGESLAIDGCWGSATEAAYDRLLTDFNLECRDARASAANKNLVLGYVVRTAFANKSAGYYSSTVC